MFKGVLGGYVASTVLLIKLGNLSVERFHNLKALYNLKKNIQYTNTHNYINQ